MIDKHDMIDKIAPICFKYTINQGQEDNTSRKLNVYIIKNKLDNVNKNVLGGSASYSFNQTEAAAYTFATKVFNNAKNLEQKKDEDFYDYEQRRELEIIKASNKRSKLLYSLYSKLAIVKVLLANIKGKSIVFGNSLDFLLKITINVISSKNSDITNTNILNDFENDKIKTIASFKKIKQGSNLPKLDNCIISSFYSSEVDLIQRLGRMRQDGDKIGNAFIIVTDETQEVVWFNKMMENANKYNIIYCESLTECLTKYKENE
jgi:hypothetical protein